MNQFIAGEKDMNDEKLWNYLKYHNSQFLIKNVIRAKQSKNVPLFKKKVLKIKIQKKIVDIIAKLLDFDKQQEGKGRPSMLASHASDLNRLARVAIVSDRMHIKPLTPKQVLQRLLIVFAQVKAGNTPKMY